MHILFVGTELPQLREYIGANLWTVLSVTRGKNFWSQVTPCSTWVYFILYSKAYLRQTFDLLSMSSIFSHRSWGKETNTDFLILLFSSIFSNTVDRQVLFELICPSQTVWPKHFLATTWLSAITTVVPYQRHAAQSTDQGLNIDHYSSTLQIKRGEK